MINSPVIDIEEIHNYYGSLQVISLSGKYYWRMENHNTNEKEFILNKWVEIDETFYNSLINRNKLWKLNL